MAPFGIVRCAPYKIIRYLSNNAPTHPIPATTNSGPDLEAIDLATVLHALADPVRLAIVRQVDALGAGCELGCGEIELPVSKSTGSHHLKNLLASGITAEREEGTRKYIRLRREELDQRFPGLMDSVLRAAGGTK